MTELTTAADHALIVKRLHWPDEIATQATAQALALSTAICNVVITLEGQLGAGKTTFARHLLTALGVQGRIKSPTYAVVEAYTLETSENTPMHIWHCDFYRFNDPDEWEEAGFRDIFASRGLKLVEWPDKAAGYLPQADVQIVLTSQIDTSRHVMLSAFTPAGVELANALP